MTTATDRLTLEFHVTQRGTRHTYYTVIVGGRRAGDLVVTNRDFDAIVTALDAGLAGGHEFSAEHVQPDTGWTLVYGDGFWSATCPQHPDVVLADEDLGRAASIAAYHMEGHYR